MRLLMLVLLATFASCSGYVSGELIEKAQKTCESNGGLLKLETYDCNASGSCLKIVCRNGLRDTLMESDLK